MLLATDGSPYAMLLSAGKVTKYGIVRYQLTAQDFYELFARWFYFIYGESIYFYCWSWWLFFNSEVVTKWRSTVYPCRAIHFCVFFLHFNAFLYTTLSEWPPTRSRSGISCGGSSCCPWGCGEGGGADTGTSSFCEKSNNRTHDWRINTLIWYCNAHKNLCMFKLSFIGNRSQKGLEITTLRVAFGEI